MRKALLGSGEHLVVKGVTDNWLAGEEPEEALGDATGVND